MPRAKLPDRRVSITSKIEHVTANGDVQKYFVTFGCDREGSIREVFCADAMIGSDMHAITTDACILISIHLQTGGEPERLVRSLSENRTMDGKSGPPASVIGSIARAIVDVQQAINRGDYECSTQSIDPSSSAKS